MRRRSSLALLLVLCSTSSVACEGDGGPVLSPDGGAQPDATPAPSDAGPERDRVRPSVLQTMPADREAGVAPDARVVVRFSEGMQPASDVTLEANGATLAIASTEWSDDATTLTIDPELDLPSQARVRVTIDEGFADLAGNTLGAPYSFGFEVRDVVPPHVVDSTPAPGASGLSARLDEIEIEFDELMNATMGTARLEGGGTTGALSWIDGRTVRVPVDGLAYGTSYALALEGFADAAGNALDTTTYLVEGALPFSTGADADGPRVADSSPAEAQVNVSVRTDRIVVVFDEPMDTSITTAQLSSAAGEITLTGTWTDGGTRLSLTSRGRLAVDSPHALDLRALRDARGNALDGAQELRDGRLDFVTGADARPAVALYAVPGEGASDVSHETDTVLVVFDQAMDRAATTVRIDDGVAPFDAPISWNLAGTQLRANVAGRLASGRDVSVDVTALSDARGLPLDATHPYLGDGVLEFETQTPRGERCRDELTVAQASAPSSGVFEWTIPATAVDAYDGSNSCDDSGTSADAVVRYTKTSAAGSSGGTYLHVFVDGLSTDDIDIDVYRDVCDPASSIAPSARLTCPFTRESWDTWLDVGAGDYFVWVATGSGAFDGATVRIEEVPAVPEGESCNAPFTTGSTSHSIGPDGEHVWTLAPEAVSAVDMYVTWGGAGAMVCDVDYAAGPVHGADAVIAVHKASDTSVLQGVLVPDAGATATTEGVNLQVLDTCDPTSAEATSLVCEHAIRAGTTATTGPRDFEIRGGAGTYYLWLASDRTATPFPGATVRLREVDIRPGDSCESAIAIGATGPSPITPASTVRLAPPSCFGATDNVTWYRFTASENLALVGTNATGAISTVDAASGRELGCSADASSAAIAAFMRAGQDVCVAVANGSMVSQLAIEPVAYRGVMGIPTQLEIDRPFSATGEHTITTDQWMTVTPSTLYMMSTTTAGLVYASRTGGTRAQRYDAPTEQNGNAGVSVGEAVFGLDESNTATGPRLWRLVSPAGAHTPMAWDSGFTYPTDGFDSLAYDGTSLWLANDVRPASGTTTTRLDVTLYRASPTSPSTPIRVGAIPALADTVAIAVDATYVYLLSRVGTVEGVYRVARADLPGDMAVPQLVVAIPTSTTRGSLAIDSTTAATYLYVRDDDTGDLHVVADPGSATPRHLGVLSTLGNSGDDVFAYDPAAPALYLFETESRTTGSFVRLD